MRHAFSYTILIFLLTALGACRPNRKALIITRDISSFCEFVEIDMAFNMIVISYIPAGCECGNRACASNCVGITNKGDTIRVLSLCNKVDFNSGQKVVVTPQEKPEFEVMVAQIWLDEKKQVFIPEIQKRKLKTIYGKITEDK